MPAAAHAGLASEIARASALFAQESAQVEQFKSELAVLRNSVRYLPVVARERALDLGSGPEAADEVAGLQRLTLRVLEVSTYPDAAHSAVVEREIRGLRTRAWSAATERVLRHADIVVERGPRVGRLLREVVATPFAEHLDRYAARYAEAHEAAVGRFDLARVGVALGLLCMFAFGGLSVLLRMRATARELSLASERLRASLDQQHRFVSMTSHEFRTPLSVIVSSSDLLHAYSERWDAEQRNKHLDRIARSARGMTDLLDGLLLIGRTDAGHVDFRPTRTDVLGLVQEVAENQRLRAKNDVSVVVTHALGERPVRIDPRLVRHVLDNLVSNAVKYSTAAGKVEIDVSIVGSQMRIRVSDHGIGIPAEDLSRLFSSFHRSDNVGLVPGAGLGLAIVKRAVEQHRGTIEVRSEVGVGTTFEVFLPVELLEADDMGSSEGNAS